MTSCLVSRSISSMRSMSNLPLLPDGFGGGLRDHAQLGLGIAGMGLDLEPDAEPVFRLPDRGHFRAAIARDHRSSLNAAGWRGNRRIAATIAGVRLNCHSHARDTVI